MTAISHSHFVVSVALLFVMCLERSLSKQSKLITTFERQALAPRLWERRHGRPGLWRLNKSYVETLGSTYK